MGQAGQADQLTDWSRADYFISRAGADKAFAIWLGSLIEASGKTCILQDKDFGYQNFKGAMHEALKSDARVVAIYSPDYMKSQNCMTEALGAISGDSFNKAQRLIPLRLVPCTPEGLLSDVAFCDLIPERRMGDADALIVKILRALGLDASNYAAMPRPPEGILNPDAHVQILHSEITDQRHFTGRAGDMENLENLLFSSGQVAVTGTKESAAISGMGGIGKSVMAKQFGWLHRDQYQGVWWLGAETRDSLINGLITLGGRLGLQLADMPDRMEAARLTLHRIESGGDPKPWLLIYDNVVKPDALKALTPIQGAHLLFTSRSDDWPSKLALDCFDRPTSIAFLLERTERQGEAGAEAQADAEVEPLAELLGDLPLALEQAASYCRSAHMSFAEYIIHHNELLKRKPTSGNYPDSVFGTFSLALDRVIKTVPEAEKFVGLLAYLAPDDIPLDVFTDDIMSLIEKGEAVAALSEVSLIERVTLDDGSPAVSVHRLVQAVMRDRLGDEADAAKAIATALVANAFPFEAGDVRAWPRCVELFTHAKSVLVGAPDEGDSSDKTALLCNQLGQYLQARADYTEAEPLMCRALEIDVNACGPDHPSVARYLNNLAQLLQATNRLDEAEPLMRRALEIDEKAYGPDHPDVARGLNNLATLFLATNRHNEAEPLLERVIHIFEQIKKNTGHMDLNYAGALNNLAQLLADTGRHDEAEPLMRRVLEIDEKAYGSDHPEVATDLNNLTGLLLVTDRLVEAEPLMRRSLEIDEQAYGPDHPSVAISLNNLASLLQASGRLDEADPLAARAVAILQTNLPEGHPNILTGQKNLAAIRAEIAARDGARDAISDGGDAAEPELVSKTPKKSFLDRLTGK